MARFNIDSNINDILGQFSRFRDLISGLPGRLAGLNRSLGNLRTALISTGIGAVAVAVGTLVAAFQDWQPAIDFVNNQLAFLRGLIQGLLREIREFITGIEESNQSILDTANAARELSRASQELRDREIDLITVQAMRRVELERLRLAAADQTATEEERLSALERAIEVQASIFESEREIAQERVRILEEQAMQAENSAEEQRELQEARAALILLDAQQAQMSRELIGVASGLRRVINARNNEQERQVVTTQNVITATEELIETEVELMDTSQMVTDALRQEQLRRAQIAQTQMEADNAVRDQRIQNLGALGDALTTFAGESKGLAIAGLLVEQAAGVASTLVQGQIASASALAPPPVGLGPVAGAPLSAAIQVGTGISIASIIASTVQGIQQINQTPGPAAGGVAGGGGASGIPFGPTVATPPTINQQQQESDLQVMMQMMQGITTVQAVVAEGDISVGNERAARTRNRRRLGRS